MCNISRCSFSTLPGPKTLCKLHKLCFYRISTLLRGTLRPREAPRCNFTPCRLRKTTLFSCQAPKLRANFQNPFRQNFETAAWHASPTLKCPAAASQNPAPAPKTCFYSMSKLPRGTFHPPLQCPAATSACSQAAKLLASFAASKPVSKTFRNCRAAPFTQIPFHSGSKLPRGMFHPPLTCPAAASQNSAPAPKTCFYSMSKLPRGTCRCSQLPKPASIAFRSCRVLHFTHPPLKCLAAASECSRNSLPAPPDGA